MRQSKDTGKKRSRTQKKSRHRSITKRPSKTESQSEMAITQANERKFDGVVEHSIDGIVIADERGIIIEWNSGQEQITGLKRSNMLGKYVWEAIFQVSSKETQTPDVLKQLKSSTLEFLKSGKAGWMNRILEREVMQTKGARLYVQAIMFPIKTPKGWMSVSIARDITEIKRAEENLRESEEKYRNLFENSVMGISQVLPDGSLINANAAYAKMFGFDSPERMMIDVSDIGKQLYSNEEDWQEILRILREKGIMEPREMSVVRRDHSNFHVLVGARAIRDAQEKPLNYQVEHIDITERKAMEEILRAMEERYRAVVEDQTEAICRFRSDGTFILVNNFYCRFLNKPVGEIIGKRWQPLALPEEVPYIEEQLRKLSPSNPILTVENRVISGSGQIHWMQFVNHGFFDEHGTLTEIQSVARDITDRKELEVQLLRHQKDLRELTNRLVSTQETERKAISRELHDEIGQALTAVKFNLAEIEKDLPSEIRSRIRKRIIESNLFIEKILEQIHEMSLDLHPAMLDDLGLAPTVRWYIKRFSKRTGIDVDLEVEDQIERLGSDLETNLYRIIQEALTNVIKHAQAKKVMVRLERDTQALRLSIADDGAGFDTKALEGAQSGTHGMGLIGMHERINSLKGVLDIDSSPSRGTILRITVPWKEK